MPLTRRPIPAESIKQQQFVSLSERMSRDLATFGAPQRRDADADELGSMLQLPDPGAITGTTGYESMLESPEATEAPETGYESPEAAQAPRRPRMQQAPALAMPEIDMGGDTATIYDPADTGEIQGAPQYDPTEDAQLSAPSFGSAPTASAAPAAAPGAAVSIPGRNPEKQAQVYQAARAAGRSDEDARILVAVTETEAGLDGAVGDNGQSHGIYQFHDQGEKPAFRAWLRKQGIEGDPNQLAYDPDIATQYAATGYLGQALDRGRQLGYSGAELATYVQRTGQRSVDPGKTGENYTRLFGSGAPSASVQAPSATQRASEGRAQAGEMGPPTEDVAQAALTSPTKWAECGPVAAVIAANRRGKTWTVDEARQIAVENKLWDASTGMYGLNAQVTMLNKMGLGARTGPADLQSLIADAKAGNTPIVSTPAHYFILVGYDDKTGKFDTTTSGTALRRGTRNLSLDEISSIGGGIQGAAYMDNPASQTPSAVAPPSQVVTAQSRRDADALSLKAMIETPSSVMATPTGPDGALPPPSGPTASIGQPMPEGASQEERLVEQLTRPGPKPAPLRNDVPFNPETGQAGWPDLQRAPLADATPVRDRWADEQGQPYDPDQGPREATPGSVGAAPLPQFDPDQGPREAIPGSVGAQPLPATWQTNPADQVDPTQPGALRVEDLPNQGAGRGWNPAPPQPQGGIQIPDATLNTMVPRAAQTPALTPQQDPNPPNRWSPQGQPSVYRQEPAEDAAAEIERDQQYASPAPSNPLEHAVSSAGRAQFLRETAGEQAVSIYGAIQALPFDAYATARRQLISDLEAKHVTGIDPIAPLRASFPDAPWPSVETLNPDKRPASDVLMGMFIQGALPDPADPLVQTAFRGVGLAARGTAAVGRATGRAAGEVIDAASPAIRRGAEAAGDAWQAGRQTARELNAAPPSGTVAPASLGALPDGPRPNPSRPTVEVLQSQIETARTVAQRAREMGNPDQEARAMDAVWGLESDLVDAVNARRGLEPAIRSDVGRRIEELPLDEQSADNLTVIGRERARVAPDDLSGPVGVPQNSISLNAGLGALPDSAPRRMYHGTAGEFAAPDPTRFDENGLFGPGYYLTSDPRVASSYADARSPVSDAARRVEQWDAMISEREAKLPTATPPQARRLQREIDTFRRDRAGDAALLNEVASKESAGPNVRAVNVPPGLRMLDADVDVSRADVDRIMAVLGPDAREAIEVLIPSSKPAIPFDDLYRYLDFALRDGNKEGGKAAANRALQSAGFDGIQHTGGKRIPMMDDAGNPIEHDVTIVFPESLTKITNAFSGEVGGAGIGALPPGGPTGSGALNTFNRAASEAIVGSVGGATIGGGLPAENDEERRANTLRGAALGAVGFPLATRAARGAARLAGAGAEEAGGALATLGSAPATQSVIGRFPGVQQAIDASKQRAARMAATGVQPLSPLQWTRKAAASLGYSSMIGPSTATVNVFGNLLEPLWAIPKEATRAVVRRNAREFTTMAAGSFKGMGEVGTAMVDAIMARGRYASNPDHPMLSEQTINPIGHAIATSLEFGGRVFSGMPDAIFGTVARSAGEAREAAQIATDMGLKGDKWKSYVDVLLKDADAQRTMKGTKYTSANAQRVLKAGTEYADSQTFRQELGTIGNGASGWAGRNIPVVGNLITPFFNTPWNMELRRLERSPIGFAMNSQPTRFDKRYDAIVGSALITGLAVGPAASGAITGSGPSDPEKRKMLEAEGWKPYHTLVGDTYVPNRVFGIYGAVLNAAGDAHDAMAYQKKDADLNAMGDDAMRRIGNMVKEEPYLQGLADILGMFGANGGADAVNRYAASTATRMVPYGATARAIGTAADPNEREVDRGKGVSPGETFTQRVQQGLGMRSDLPVAQDALGRPKENPQQGLSAILPKTARRNDQPVVRAYLDAGVDISAPPAQIEGVALTPSQRRAYQSVMGQQVQELAAPTVGDPSWKDTPPEIRAKVLEKFKEIARKLATAEIKATAGDDFWTERTNVRLEKAGVAP